MVSVDGVVDPGEMVEGLKAQVMPDTEEQDSVIWLLNPPTALALMESVAEPPGATVADCADKLREKSALVTADAGTSVANRPLVWFAPPAVK